MQGRQSTILDGNEAALSVAYRLTEVNAIYPITPSSSMGELADEWAAQGRTNVWGTVPSIVEMQSEGGAAGAVHGALQAGALATTYTASQGLLLMIPNMYKIAGELTAYCMHVAARTVATHALSIFGDHSDVMACRQTGFALLSSGNVQEAHDFACIGHAATLESRVPFVHFFDGFRTSHELARVELLTDEALRSMLDAPSLASHRMRALSPDRPVLRGAAQNPDTFFQAREACNPFYAACPSIVDDVFERFAKLTGRHYRLFDYHGHPEADRVVILMGSGAGAAREMVDHLVQAGHKVGIVIVRLYRPFSGAHLIAALPRSARMISVLDRTKEPGAAGEPLYQDVVTSLQEAQWAGQLEPSSAPKAPSVSSVSSAPKAPSVSSAPKAPSVSSAPKAPSVSSAPKAPSVSSAPRVVAGRYGLSSKEFTPAMVQAVFDDLAADAPRQHFTVGIVDDVSRLSLPVDASLDIEADDVSRAVFFGLGSDGTVSANKNSIKIIGQRTDRYVQGYFVYDSKKAGAVTVSHLRFSPRPIESSYLVGQAQFIGCHQFGLIERYDVLRYAADQAVLLLNAPYSTDQVWDRLSRETQAQILDKQVRVFAIDATAVAREAGMGRRINTIMQTCFFAISGVLPRDEAIQYIKDAIADTYRKKGDEVVRRNWAAVDATLAHLHKLDIPAAVTATHVRPPIVSAEAPEQVQRVTAMMLANQGDLLPVSAFPVDGTWPVGTSRWEKRNIAPEIPIWDPDVCIQCNKCVLVCPHAAIRAKLYPKAALRRAPDSFQSVDYRGRAENGQRYTIQTAPEDCTGCTLCVRVCPAKDKGNPRHRAINMRPHDEHVDVERANYAFFLDIPEADRAAFDRLDVKHSQFLEPLFEYSGACAGCGETPYIKLLTQLFGDRALIANATGCSSIYGGNLPTTPYTTNLEGRGPAWSNSLFEDNAEFGLGFRLAADAHRTHALTLLRSLELDDTQALLRALQDCDPADVAAYRERVMQLRDRLATVEGDTARWLSSLADWLVPKSVWLVGGDGWAFDIGYGGLDHVLSMQHNVNVLVLDTEVYSNTGGQASKATPVGAAAKFAARGKETDKKDLGLMAMNYGHVYVASVAFGAKDSQTVKAFIEAESYDGPSLIIAYSQCIAHGYDLAFGVDQQRRAVDSGIWPLYRYDPRRLDSGEPPLVIDAPGDRIPAADYMAQEARFRMVESVDAERFKTLARRAQNAAVRRVALYRHMAKLRTP